MAIPNFGPERADPNDPDDTLRAGNAAQIYRARVATDDVAAASTRATSVTHRFGGIRYPLSRPDSAAGRPPDESGGSNESE